MQNFTIECVGYNEDEGLVLNSEEQHKQLEIKCSGVSDNNSFTMEYYGDEGILVTRNRCFLDVYLSSNKSNFNRNYNIICRHANDEDVYVLIDITQESDDFTIKTPQLQNDTVELQSVIESNTYNGDEMYYEDIDVKIDVTGGSEKYRVVGIYKCYDEKYEEDDVIVHKYPFDNGFILTKNSDGITIRNYGRPFIDENYYYVISLQHFDDRTIQKEIKIKYKAEPKRTAKRKSANKSKTIIVLPEAEKRKVKKIETEEIKQTEYKLEVLGNIKNKDYVIIGNPVGVTLPFTVTENGVESDLMVKAFSSAYWCKVNVIQEYNKENKIERKLVFGIKNKPSITRKAKITVSIIDMPEISVNFIITNKPS